MGREFELKYAATAQVHQSLLDTYGPFRQIDMETTYFDTANRAFSTRKMTLRLRRENGISICTLKTPHPRGGTGEWECEAEDIIQGLTRLIASGAPAEASQLAQAGLAPICGARFTRMAIVLPTADGTAELALDRGVLLGGGREAPLCELEVELKTGSDEATRILATQIAGQYALRTEPFSKFRRALNLAKGE